MESFCFPERSPLGWYRSTFLAAGYIITGYILMAIASYPQSKLAYFSQIIRTSEWPAKK